MLPLAISFALTPAFACEGPTHETACHLEEQGWVEADDDDEPRRGDVDLRLGLEGTGLPGAPTTGFFGELTGRRDGYARVELRGTTDERWMGRLGAGFDLLGDGPFDVRLGLFMGHVAVWQSPEYAHLAIGTEVAVGAELGRLYGTARWTGGKRPGDRGVWHETDVALGFRVAGPVRVHGHWLRLDDGHHLSSGVGLGGSITF